MPSVAIFPILVLALMLVLAVDTHLYNITRAKFFKQTKPALWPLSGFYLWYTTRKLR